ncbi:hypothetical protein [Streptomyces sp. NPDC008121]|uniref:hypothetical protein n=1 Tax=Streptomyces sp. NPDC008121 TaxID=3364809 RepID=UPI0036E3668A
MTTSAGFPAEIRIETGSADCTQLLDIFTRYYRVLADEVVQGIGGDRRVSLSDWTCQSLPERDKQAACVRGDAAVAAFIRLP